MKLIMEEWRKYLSEYEYTTGEEDTYGKKRSTKAGEWKMAAVAKKELTALLFPNEESNLQLNHYLYAKANGDELTKYKKAPYNFAELDAKINKELEPLEDNPEAREDLLKRLAGMSDRYLPDDEGWD